MASLKSRDLFVYIFSTKSTPACKKRRSLKRSGCKGLITLDSESSFPQKVQFQLSVNGWKNSLWKRNVSSLKYFHTFAHISVRWSGAKHSIKKYIFLSKGREFRCQLTAQQSAVIWKMFFVIFPPYFTFIWYIWFRMIYDVSRISALMTTLKNNNTPSWFLLWNLQMRNFIILQHKLIKSKRNGF